MYHVEQLVDHVVWYTVIRETSYTALFQGVQEGIAKGLALVCVEEGEVEGHVVLYC